MKKKNEHSLQLTIKYRCFERKSLSGHERTNRGLLSMLLKYVFSDLNEPPERRQRDFSVPRRRGAWCSLADCRFRFAGLPSPLLLPCPRGEARLGAQSAPRPCPPLCQALCLFTRLFLPSSSQKLGLFASFLAGVPLLRPLLFQKQTRIRPSPKTNTRIFLEFKPLARVEAGCRADAVTTVWPTQTDVNEPRHAGRAASAGFRCSQKMSRELGVTMLQPTAALILSSTSQVAEGGKGSKSQLAKANVVTN